MKYAVIQTGGKQYKVSEGDIIEVERLASDKDQQITFKEVLLYTNDGIAKVGMPFVDGISVGASVVDHMRGEKIRVSKFKAKARYRRVTGHRQSLTLIKIDSIGDGKAAKPTKTTQTEETQATLQTATPQVEKKPAKEKVVKKAAAPKAKKA